MSDEQFRHLDKRMTQIETEVGEIKKVVDRQTQKIDEFKSVRDDIYKILKQVERIIGR